MAKQFEDHGIDRLHLVDLDGTREKKVINHRVLEQIASRTSLVIDAGGGLRTDEDLHVVFESGAHMITGGSIAVKDRPTFLGWLNKYGPEKIILGADFKKGKISVSGWHEETSLDLMEFIADFHQKGVDKTICTDIDKDGMLEGPSIDMYTRIKKAQESLFLIASGGISNMKDIELLDEQGIDGVIVGKAIYENKIDLKTIESYIIKNS